MRDVEARVTPVSCEDRMGVLQDNSVSKVATSHFFSLRLKSRYVCVYLDNSNEPMHSCSMSGISKKNIYFFPKYRFMCTYANVTNRCWFYDFGKEYILVSKHLASLLGLR